MVVDSVGVIQEVGVVLRMLTSNNSSSQFQRKAVSALGKRVWEVPQEKMSNLSLTYHLQMLRANRNVSDQGVRV